MIDIAEINRFQAAATADWHDDFARSQTEAPLAFVEENHWFNFDLWHEEDVARRDDIPAERIKQAKRKIDKCNQARNNAMEKIDDWILSEIKQRQVSCPDGLLHSETPGMMIDRLSIMALKVYHMQEQVDRKDATPEHKEKCAARVVVLDEQRADLSASLEALLGDVFGGRRRFKVYRQFKMYNDPDSNPQLYQKGKS
ncbi:DUF4254 domain-containing protein [Luteolibacter sp. AS25]|uniref:DUF4254 domain-containing protein n=1 Tax=Luteolibacter sp. AS25 TaxID=3135776 RepID=UPI00398B8914